MSSPAQTPSTFPRAIFESSVLLFQEQRWLPKMNREFCELLDSCPSDGHRQMLIDLLARTTYVTADRYFGFVSRMREHVETVWKLTPTTTLFVSSNKDHADSSREVLNQLKSTRWEGSGWKKQQFHVSFSTAIEKANNHDTLVIVDDFVGSGGSMLKALTWLAKAAFDRRIVIDLRVLTVGGCKEGIEFIEGKGYEVQCMVPITKGLSDHLSGQQLIDSLRQMTDLENAMAAEIHGGLGFDKYRFGWGKQEAVYVRQGGNTPNNVFPVFWWRRLKNRMRLPIMNRT